MKKTKARPSLAATAATTRVPERDALLQKICSLGGVASSPMTNQVSDVELTFLRRVIAFEEGPFTSHREWLRRHLGLTFPPLAEIAPEKLPETLWRLIEGLAKARVFLEQTDHLSDAELYVRLTTEVLESDAPDCTRTEDDVCHWDMADPSNDPEIWLTYYADEDDRAWWRSEFPNVALPTPKAPPHARDQRLPRPH